MRKIKMCDLRYVELPICLYGSLSSASHWIDIVLQVSDWGCPCPKADSALQFL